MQQYTESHKSRIESLPSLKNHASASTRVQPPNWIEPFHMYLWIPQMWQLAMYVFVDISDVAISNVLMQLYEPCWYRPVYYVCMLKLSKAMWIYSTTMQIMYACVLLEKKFSFHGHHSVPSV
jgi:hypothetical protein